MSMTESPIMRPERKEPVMTAVACAIIPEETFCGILIEKCSVKVPRE
jgi:hypothetical protein